MQVTTADGNEQSKSNDAEIAEAVGRVTLFFRSGLTFRLYVRSIDVSFLDETFDFI